jgi:hypothetical protein
MDNISKLEQEIYTLIEQEANIDAYEHLYKNLSKETPLPAMRLPNKDFFRVRKDNGKLFTHISQMKYPPRECATKNRFNDIGESIAYLSTSQIGNLAEMDIGYYQIYCTANIEYIDQDILFHCVGLVGDKIKIVPSFENRVQILYRNLITSKEPKVYNATIALGRHLLSANFKIGILYSSVHGDKSNWNLYNVAVKPDDFDECFKIVSLEYNILRFSPEREAVIETINMGRPEENGSITWQLSYDEMIGQTNQQITGEVFKDNNVIIHYKYGEGHIHSQTANSYFVRFVQSGKLIEVLKSEVR